VSWAPEATLPLTGRRGSESWHGGMTGGAPKALHVSERRTRRSCASVRRATEDARGCHVRVGLPQPKGAGGLRSKASRLCTNSQTGLAAVQPKLPRRKTVAPWDGTRQRELRDSSRGAVIERRCHIGVRARQCGGSHRPNRTEQEGLPGPFG
jgi:hypothetical protein